MNKDLLIRFILGGAAVMLSYLVTVVSPWELLSGIFAAFPAVMITAVMMVSIHSGTKQGSYIAKGSVYGMIGGVCCAITVLLALQVGMGYVFSVVAGLVAWLISSFLVSYLRTNIVSKAGKNK